ncbi:hypothetical protein IT575_06890 [bacterium]|nr:hypothetical protein [bacterium]
MRANMTLFIIIGACILVAVAYTFLGKMKLDELVATARSENESLTAQRDLIVKHTQEIPVLAKQQGKWLESLELFRDAIPNEINDHVFFTNLSREMASHNVRMLGVKLGSGGQWMGKIRDEQAEHLDGIGVDVKAAKQVKIAYYSIKLVGEYDQVLTVFENLKRYRRLYTIDQITSPTGGAAGTVTQVLNSNETGIEVTGKIYYGIPEDFINTDELIAKIIRNLIGPAATKIQRNVGGRGQELLNSSSPESRTQLDRPAADLGVSSSEEASSPAPDSESEVETDTKTGWEFVPGVAAASSPAQETAAAGAAG